MKTFICDHCQANMIPLEFNLQADEALCSKCYRWFCYNHNNPSRMVGMAPDNITEVVEKIYNGNMDEDTLLSLMMSKKGPLTWIR